MEYGTLCLPGINILKLVLDKVFHSVNMLNYSEISFNKIQHFSI
jgi:hypothetical protein